MEKNSRAEISTRLNENFEKKVVQKFCNQFKFWRLISVQDILILLLLDYQKPALKLVQHA